MADSCCKCQKGDPGGPETIELKHVGFRFRVFKSGLTCAECSAKETREFYDGVGEKYVSSSEGRPVVNWKAYVELKGRGGNNSRELFVLVSMMLVALGVLSPSLQDNWTIVSEHAVTLNPRPTSTAYFFTDRKYAAGFAKEALAGTVYNWWIFRMGEVVSKEEVLVEPATEEV